MTKLIQKKKLQRRAQQKANLFTVKEDCKKLDKEISEQLNSTVAQVLFTTKCDRPDTDTAVSFFTKRVREPDQYDWLKLSHLMMYIRGTIDLPLTLSDNGMGILK